MSLPSDRRSLSAWILVVVVIASIVYATPWATPFRTSVRPMLPLVGVICGTLSGAWFLVTALVEGTLRAGGWSTAAPPLALGLSSICVALTFVPMGAGKAQNNIFLVPAVVFSLLGMVLVRRAAERRESLGERSE